MSLSSIQAAAEHTNAAIDTTSNVKSLEVATESPTNVILAVNESIFRVGDATGQQQLSSTTTTTSGDMHNNIRRSACFTPSLSTASTLSDDTDTSDDISSDDGTQQHHLHRYLPRQRQRQQTSLLQSIFRRPVCGIKRSSPDVSEEENEDDDDDEHLSLPMKKRPSLGSIKKANPVGSDDAGFDEPTDELQQQFDIPSSPGQRIEDTPLSSSMSSPYTSLFAASSSTSPYTSLFAEVDTSAATTSREPLIEIAPTHHHLAHPLSCPENSPRKMSAHDMIKN